MKRTFYSLALGYFILLPCFAKAQLPGAVIDVQHYAFSIQLNAENNNIEGQAAVTAKFLKPAASFSLNLIRKNNVGKGMIVTSVTEAGKPLTFSQDSSNVIIKTAAKLSSTHTYTIKYSGVPADGLIISTNKYKHRTFFGDNWPNRAQNWLPCVDHPADKASVEFTVTAPDHYSVVANGLKLKEQPLPGHLKLTHWSEKAAISTKVMVIGVADFAIDHTGDVEGIPVYTYVFPESKEVGFKSYAVAKDILPYFIKNVGPFAYGKLANVQSKTIFGGMENASAIFYFEESVNTPEIEELMAHEIAHQWFGDAASEKSWANLWLSEGFATYMTNLYLENKYGVEMLKKRLLEQRKKVIGFEKSRMTPVVDTAVSSNYMQLLNANSYEKGGWVLHMLRRKLGDEFFWKGVRTYFAQYNGKNANSEDLRAVMEKASGVDLKQFFKQWLYTAGHPNLKIEKTISNGSKSIILKITQTQGVLYQFPLEVLVDGKLQQVDVVGKETVVAFPSESGEVVIDPNVDLLATLMW